MHSCHVQMDYTPSSRNQISSGCYNFVSLLPQRFSFLLLLQHYLKDQSIVLCYTFLRDWISNKTMENKWLWLFVVVFSLQYVSRIDCKLRTHQNPVTVSHLLNTPSMHRTQTHFNILMEVSKY